MQQRDGPEASKAWRQLGDSRIWGHFRSPFTPSRPRHSASLEYVEVHLSISCRIARLKAGL